MTGSLNSSLAVQGGKVHVPVVLYMEDAYSHAICVAVIRNGTLTGFLSLPLLEVWLSFLRS